MKPAHWLPKPLVIGDQKVALCGEVVTVTQMSPSPGQPICGACQARYDRLPSFVWRASDKPPTFRLAISA